MKGFANAGPFIACGRSFVYNISDTPFALHNGTLVLSILRLSQNRIPLGGGRYICNIIREKY